MAGFDVSVGGYRGRLTALAKMPIACRAFSWWHLLTIRTRVGSLRFGNAEGTPKTDEHEQDKLLKLELVCQRDDLHHALSNLL